LIKRRNCKKTNSTMSGYIVPYKGNKILVGKKRGFGSNGWMPNNCDQLVLIGGGCKKFADILKEFREETGNLIRYDDVKFIKNDLFIYGFYEVKTVDEYDRLSKFGIHRTCKELTELIWMDLNDVLNEMKRFRYLPEEEKYSNEDEFLRQRFSEYLEHMTFERLHISNFRNGRNLTHPFNKIKLYGYHKTDYHNIQRDLISGKKCNYYEKAFYHFSKKYKKVTQRDWFLIILEEFLLFL